MPKQRSGNSPHKMRAKQTNPITRTGSIGARQKATVFDWEEASRRERVFKAKAGCKAMKAKAGKTRKKSRISGSVLSEIEFAQAHKISKPGFNQMIKGLRKLNKLREKDHRTRGKRIIDPSIIARFLRELKDREAVNLPEHTIIAFSNWALGRDHSKLKAIK